MKLYDWDVDVIVRERGKTSHTEKIRVQSGCAVGAKMAAENKRGEWPFEGQVIAFTARRGAFVKEVAI